MQEAILSVSLKTFKAEIDDLKGSLLGLEKGSAEYEKTLKELQSKQEKLNEVMTDSKRAVNAAEGSYNALVQEMADLKKAWKATNDEGKRNELGKQIETLNTQLKDLDASIGNHQRNVGDYAIAGESMKSQLKGMTEEMANMLANGVNPTDAGFIELAKKAGQMKDAMADAKSIIGQFADDTKGLSTALDVAKTGTAVFGAWEGAMSAFGVESESAAKAIQKLQGVMTLLNSLQTIQTALIDHESKTYQALVSVYNKLVGVKTAEANATKESVVATKASETASKADTVAKNAETVATKEATVAAKGLRTAIVQTGIGALVVALGYLIANLDKVKSALFGSSTATEKYKTANDHLKDSIDKVDSSTNNYVKILRAQGKTEVEIIKAKIKGKEAEIAKTEATIASTKATYEQAKANSVLYKSAMLLALSSALNWGKGNWLEKMFKSVANWAVDADEFNKSMKDLQNTLNGLKQDKIDLDFDFEAQQIQDAREAAEEAIKEGKKNAEEAHKEYVKSINDEIELNKKKIAYEKSEKEYLYELAKARGKVTEAEEASHPLEQLKEEKKALEQEKALYENAAKDKNLTEDEKKDYLKKAVETQTQIVKKGQEIEIETAKETTDAYKKEVKKRLAETKKMYQSFLDDTDFQFSQVEVGFTPTVNLKKLKDVKFGSDDFKKILAPIQDEIDKASEDLNINPINSDYDALAEQYQSMLQDERSYGNELLGVKKENLSQQYDLEIAYNEQMYNLRMGELESQIAQQEQNLSKLTEGSADYNDAEMQLEDLKQQKAQETADYIIGQQDRINQKRKADKKAHKDWVQANINSTLQMTKSIGSLMGSISDIMEANIDQKVKNGEISEEEAEKEFERVKKVQSAELWINTIAGAAGAFLQDMKSYPSPYNAIIAAIDMTTALATGVAQQKKIQQSTYSSSGSGSGGGSGIASVAVSPLLDSTVDVQSMTAINTSEIASNQTNTRVYITQKDLEDSSKQVEVRQSNSTF